MPSKMNSIILPLLLYIWNIADGIGADNSTEDSSSKMVTILYPQSQNFYAGTANLNKIVNIVFGSELDKQNPSCVVDQDSDNSSIAGHISSPFVIYCVLSQLSSLSVGQHKLWVIRSPELRQSTYQLQNPIQLTILPDPASPSTSQWNLTLNPVAAKFSNSVDQIQLEMASNLTNIDLGKIVNKSKLDLECQQMLEQTMVAKLGNSPNCSILFDGTNFIGQIMLGENATLLVGTRISFYLIKFTGANGDNSFQISPTNQTAKTILVIGNATNPSIPVISLQTTAKRIDICASNASTIQINASAANAIKMPPLICKWNVKIPNIEAANLAKLTSSVNACSIAFSSKNVANSLANLSYVSAPVGLEMSVSACNLVGLCSAAQKITLPMDSARKLEATILGLPSSIIASARILLNSKVVYSECGADKFGPNISFIWSINNASASNSSVFTIAPYTFAPGMVVPVKLTVKHESGMETSDSGTINFELEPIVPIVDATLRTIPDGSSCQLDASASWSPNVRDWPLQHNWQCLNLTDAGNGGNGQECQLGDLQQQQMANNNGYLVLSGGKLRENGSFLFIDKINDSANATGQLEVRVKVLSANAPSVKLVEDGQNSMPLGFLHVKGLVRNPIGIGGILMLKWTLFEGKGNQTIDLDELLKFDSVKNLSMAANAGQTIILQISLPINKMDDFPEWPGLNPDQDYFLRLSANNGKGPSAFAQYQFRIHSLPNIDKLTVTPDSIASLDTLVRIQPSGQFDESEESIYRIRFGIRYLMADNESNRDVWSKGSVQSKLDGVFYETMLPTAWPQPHASCGQRIGYQALFEICDRIYGRCAQFVSDNFTVGQFSMETIGRAVYLLEKRLDNGDVFGALELLDAVNQELCGQWRNTQLLNEILDSLIDQIENSTDSEELLESLEFGIRMAEAASSSNIQKIVFLLNQTKIALNGGDGVQSRRVKRDLGQQIAQGTKTSISSVPSSSTISAPKKISESTANILLVSYDLLLGKDQNVVTVYLSNIGDILASFCTQISQTSMQAYGKSYTSVQAQGIEPGQSGFSNQTFALGGNQTKILTFGPIFASMFSNWLCGADGTQICTQICLASAITVLQAVRDNEYLRQQFFMPQYAMLSVDQAVSNLYHIYLLDPTTGSNVSLSSQGLSPFSVAVNVSIESYQPSAYYRCFFYNGAQWNDSACASANSAKMVSPGQFQLQCICHRLGGILGVFNVNPPIPPPYPSHSEIQLNFTLNASQIPSSAQISQFFDQLSKGTGILSRRFVSLNSSIPVNSSFVMVSTKLRPPFSSDQLTNSYAMQALKRTISCDGGFTAYDNVIVLNMTDSIVKRAMVGDGNARRIPLRIDRSFKDVIGQNTNDTSSIAFRWLSSMGRNMRISEFRFKNPAILMGILFNFTITLPFDGESAAYDETPLSAEEISLLIQEMTFYGELDLRDQRDQLLPVDPLSYAEIVELIVLNKTNPMTYWLGGIVGLFITLSTLLIGALVFLKIRCDRLIEQHNENMRTIDLCRTAPINVLPMSGAEQIGGPNQGPSSSTDTVVFGGQGRRRAGRGQTKIDG